MPTTVAKATRADGTISTSCRSAPTRSSDIAAYYGYRFSAIDAALPPVNTAGSAVIVGFDYRL